MDPNIDRRSWELGFVAGKETGLRNALDMLTAVSQCLEATLKKGKEPKDA